MLAHPIHFIITCNHFAVKIALPFLIFNYFQRTRILTRVKFITPHRGLIIVFLLPRPTLQSERCLTSIDIPVDVALCNNPMCESSSHTSKTQVFYKSIILP